MAYDLRKSEKKRGTYLQIYENFWVKELKQPRARCVKTIGYVADLISNEMPDPVSYYKKVVDDMNEKRLSDIREDTRPRAFTKQLEKNIGHYLVASLIDELGVKEIIDILASSRLFQFSIYDMICQLIYSRIICPCSKSKTVSDVFPILYKFAQISEDQVYDGCKFIGGIYKRIIELFNMEYAKRFERDYSKVYFDCTNYYFEIDLPREDLQKGPSKENSYSPIIGQALLLDSDMIPVAMEMYPGNESEKPYIRKTIEEMKRRYKVEGRTIQVADKGLNCARNIYAAVVESSDGYIFSKSIHGTSLNDAEKQWVLLENSANVFTDHKDENGQLLYRLKSCIDVYEYSFKETDPETGKDKVTKFKVKEKRVVSYNPKLAAKQRKEITKMAEKASNCVTYKKLVKEELGDAAKYVRITNKDKNGNKIEPIISLDNDKLEEDLRYVGYNLIVTSETKMSSEEVYRTYHNLWKIEDSFRVTKSFLDARPVYVQKKETIYGHFLICYLSLFLLRILEIKCFKGKISSYELIDFIRDFRVVDKGDDTYINISKMREVNEKIRALTGNTTIDALVLTEKELDTLFNRTLLLP